MANSINTNFFLQYKNAGQIGKNTAGTNKAKGSETKDPFAQYGCSTSVELSSEGLSALAVQQKNSAGDAGDGSGSVKAGEGQLSVKAQDFLAKLKEKYGDYDFIVADDVDNPLDMASSTKRYSVILSSQELERMAEDEEYADKVMGQVDKAIGVADKLSESGQLGEGVSFSKIAISIDEEGNMKLFAELERASQEQADRLEAAKEKKAQEAKEKEKEEEAQEPQPLLQRFRLEASSEEELLEKILGIDWSKIAYE